MELGIAPPTFATDGWRLPASQLKRIARRAENSQFTGVWATEHLLHPPGRNYSRLDPFTTISALAGATETITLGTCILILPMRDPVLMAQRIATLQHLSEERLTLGFGSGWVEAEYDAVGIPFEERGARFTEGLEVLSKLLSGEKVTFSGEFYTVENVRLEPHVSRQPSILVGGGGIERGDERRVPDPIKERIRLYADGWLASPRPPSVLEGDWNDIADHLQHHGRDPTTLDRVGLNWLHLVPDVGSDLAEEKQRRVFRRQRNAGEERTATAMQNQLTGSVEDIRAEIETYAHLGFDELILGPTTHDPTTVQHQIELWSELL